MIYPIHTINIDEKENMSLYEIGHIFGKQARQERYTEIVNGLTRDKTKPSDNEFQIIEINCVEYDKQTDINSQLLKLRNKGFKNV